MRKIWPRMRAGYERNDDDHEDMASQQEKGDQCTQAKEFFIHCTTSILQSREYPGLILIREISNGNQVRQGEKKSTFPFTDKWEACGTL